MIGPPTRVASSAVALLLALTTLAGAPASAGAVDAARSACAPPTAIEDDHQPPASLVAGTSIYSGGVFVHGDYVYDDFGPTGVRLGLVADSSTRPAGSYTYPADEARFVNNAADLRQLRLRLDGDALLIEAHLQTLAVADTTAVAVGFDVNVDGDGDATAAAEFPHALGVSAAGLDATVTLFGDGATLTPAGGEPTPLDGASVDTDANVLAVGVPLDALGVDGDRLRVWALAGLWDAAARTFAMVLPGPPTPTTAGGRQVVADVRAFDLAFHPGEAGHQGWFDADQAAALAAADVSDMAGEVDLRLLRAGADMPWQPRQGYYEVVFFRSAFTLPPYHEGWLGPGSESGEDDAVIATGFMGAWQPYALYVPSHAEDPTSSLALTIFFHGGTRNHSDLPSGTNMQTQLGEGLGSLIVSPLARRGNEIDWDDDRMADTREVLTDVHRRFPVNPNRRYLTGYSQGGNGVYRSMTFTAEEWAAATIWAGQNPDALPWLESTRWVPPILLHSPADELVGYDESYDTHTRLTELGYEHELRTHGGEHEHQAVTDDYTQPMEWFAAHVRNPDPVRVTAVRVPAEDEPDHGLTFDHAYWLFAIEAAGPRGVIDARTRGLGGSEPSTEEVMQPETGPPTPYLREGLAYVWPGTPVEPGNLLEVDLEQISAVSVDTVRAGVDLAEPLQVRVTTDGPVRLTLSGVTRAGATLAGDGTLEQTACGPALLLHGPGEHVSTLTGVGPDVVRYGGADRIQTAVQVAGASVGSAGVVVLARADDYADALAGAPLAASLGAPLMLSASDRLSGAVAAEIEQLGASSVLLGGTAALGPQVEQDLRARGLSVRRVAGPDRFATAAAIAAELGGAGEVLIAAGGGSDSVSGWPDALSAAALGAATGRPVLLVTGDGVPEATIAALPQGTDVVVVGGPAAVPAEVLAAIDQRAGDVRRLWGADRYATSRAAAEEAVASGADPAVTWLATGLDWPDGLVAAAAAGLDGGVLLLLDGQRIDPAPALDFMTEHRAQLRTIRLAGGASAISTEVERAVRTAAAG